MRYATLCVIASALALAALPARTSGSAIYWADYDAGVIQRAGLDGSGVQEVLKCFPQGIALDLDARRMYWTDIPPLGSPLPGRIERANLDGSEREVLVQMLPNPVGIALQPAGGNIAAPKLLWTDTSTNDIHRADLDGSRHEIVLGDLSSPFGIAVDAVAGKMYWTRAATYLDPRPPSPAVQRANLDGTNLESLVVGLPGPTSGIALDPAAGQMYWGYFDPTINTIQAGSIRRCNLDGSWTGRVWRS